MGEQRGRRVLRVVMGFRLSRSGRFSGETDPLMEQFNASLPYDKRMWRRTSRAASPTPQRWGAGLLQADEVKSLQDGLALVGKEWEAEPSRSRRAMKTSTPRTSGGKSSVPLAASRTPAAVATTRW